MSVGGMEGGHRQARYCRRIGVAPVCLDLELLSEDEAVAALERKVDQSKARKAIYALKQADLEEFFRNPLYLDFVAAIVKAGGALPETRAGLYEQAVGQLRMEPNAQHKGKGQKAALRHVPRSGAPNLGAIYIDL